MSELANLIGYDYYTNDNEIWFNIGMSNIWCYMGVYHEYNDSYYEGWSF